MIYLLEAILMGCFATYFMDIAASFLVKTKLARPAIEPHIPGRWSLYMLKGKFTHEDIRQAPALKYEIPATLISHYLIGIALAGIYLYLEFAAPAIRDQPWLSIVYGLVTVLLPWLWLYPSIGLGFLASKSPQRRDLIVFSSMNHTNFGIGMFIWIVTLHRLFT